MSSFAQLSKKIFTGTLTDSAHPKLRGSRRRLHWYYEKLGILEPEIVDFYVFYGYFCCRQLHRTFSNKGIIDFFGKNWKFHEISAKKSWKKETCHSGDRTPVFWLAGEVTNRKAMRANFDVIRAWVLETYCRELVRTFFFEKCLHTLDATVILTFHKILLIFS